MSPVRRNRGGMPSVPPPAQSTLTFNQKTLIPSPSPSGMQDRQTVEANLSSVPRLGYSWEILGVIIPVVSHYGLNIQPQPVYELAGEITLELLTGFRPILRSVEPVTFLGANVKPAENGSLWAACVFNTLPTTVPPILPGGQQVTCRVTTAFTPKAKEEILGTPPFAETTTYMGYEFPPERRAPALPFKPPILKPALINYRYL